LSPRQRANRAGVDLAILIGDDEILDGCVTLKLMSTGKQTQVPFKMVKDAVRAIQDRIVAGGP